MPTTFLPCLPTRGASVPATPVWLHEIKYNGYRLIVQRDGNRVRLFSRNGTEWSGRYPRIVVEAGLKNKHSQFVIDGEAVVLGVDGIADFNALHSREHNDEVQLYAFDKQGTPRTPAGWAWISAKMASTTASSKASSIAAALYHGLRNIKEHAPAAAKVQTNTPCAGERLEVQWRLHKRCCHAHASLDNPDGRDEPGGHSCRGATLRSQLPRLLGGEAAGQHDHRLQLHITGSVQGDGLGPQRDVLCQPVLVAGKGTARPPIPPRPWLLNIGPCWWLQSPLRYLKTAGPPPAPLPSSGETRLRAATQSTLLLPEKDHPLDLPRASPSMVRTCAVCRSPSASPI